MSDLDSEQSRKHYLDTSVVFGLLRGTQAYRDYLGAEFRDGRTYVGSYVKMEFIRGHILPIVNFCLLLRMPRVRTLQDAVQLWTNSFKPREVKAVLSLVGTLIENHGISASDARDKDRTATIIGGYLRRMVIKLQRSYLDPGSDTTHCGRMTVTFPDSLADVMGDLEDFGSKFGDVVACRRTCRIHQFMVTRYSIQVRSIVAERDKLQSPKARETEGFIRISDELKKIVDDGDSAITCKVCEKIGDAVIALDAPRDMRLEHVDFSFDYLCPPIGQPNHRHPSESSYVKS